jgi:phosphatidylserine/phosphatidylglycerophosphate/cardiolipin synthase-like enzyme
MRTIAARSALQITFLRDVDHGGEASQPSALSRRLTRFVSEAKHTVHIAIYDFRLRDALGGPLIQALIDRANAGVDVKIAYDHTKPNTNADIAFIKLGADPAPKGTDPRMREKFGGTRVQTRAVLTIPPALANKPVGRRPFPGSRLMHDKYIIRDAHTPEATVLSSSANFTDDAWTHQENNIVQLTSAPLAQLYETDFQDLWSSGDIRPRRVNDQGSVLVGGTPIDIAFSPSAGGRIEDHIAGLISSARRRIKIAAMLITSTQLLRAINAALQTSQVPEFRGIYDGSQMANVLAIWKKMGSPKAGLFAGVARHLAKKDSFPYSRNSVHNFMHDKVIVCDDTVATGSFNFSKNATMNAENSIVIHDAGVADQYSHHIDELVKAYAGR